jgi:SAM-dependent methyltransferase
MIRVQKTGVAFELPPRSWRLVPVSTNPPTQYETDRNLSARQRLWERQDPRFDVVGWTLDLAGVEPGARVLDVGCGNGRYLSAMQSLGVEAVGCDLSPGMLKAASSHTVVAADAIRLPYRAEEFDIVLAPHMLYHVTDREAAVREFRRVLAHDGRCVAVTHGAGHLASLRVVVEAAAEAFRAGWRWTGPAEVFSLENGGRQLAVAFNDVHRVRPTDPGRAVVTDPDVIAGYVASVGDIDGPELAGSWDRVVAQVRASATQIIQREGAFVVEGDVGAFVCS